MLEVDDEGGRMFLRVLIHLTMHDYAPLVSGALQLLFKHFSQRQEAMHTFKQVLPPSTRALREREGGPGTTWPPHQAGRLPWPRTGRLWAFGVGSDGGGAHSSPRIWGSQPCWAP